MARVKHNALHQYTTGLNNASNTGPSAVPFPTPGMQGWKYIYEDFAGGQLYTGDNIKWEFTAISSGTAPVGANGVNLTTDGNDNSGVIIQHTTPNIQVGAATKKFYLETSINLTAATMASNELFIGVTSDQGTTIADFVAAAGTSWAFDDGFGFGKLDAETELFFIARQSDVEQTVGFGSTLTTATLTRLGCYYDGTAYFLFKDGEQVASSTQSTYNNDAVMGVSCFIRAGTAAAQTCLVHYVTLATEL